MVVNHQYLRCYANIPMSVVTMMNAIITQRRGYDVGIPMSVLCNSNALMVQLGTSCSFDSPGLARDKPTPGKRLQGDSTP